jgi:large subunit ribosomal protein L9
MPKTLRLLLTRDVPSLGASGEEVHVAAAYAQRVLLPQGSAVVASARERARIAKERARLKRIRAAAVAQQHAITAACTGKTLLLSVPASGSRLYGSAGASEIVAAAKASFGVSIDPSWLTLPEPIRHLGDYTVLVSPPDVPPANLAVTVSAL